MQITICKCTRTLGKLYFLPDFNTRSSTNARRNWRCCTWRLRERASMLWNSQLIAYSTTFSLRIPWVGLLILKYFRFKLTLILSCRHYHCPTFHYGWSTRESCHCTRPTVPICVVAGELLQIVFSVQDGASYVRPHDWVVPGEGAQGCFASHY